MGCNCGKGRSLNPGATPQSRRITMYQVLVGGNVVSEHESLPNARKEAVASLGRVKVISKMVNI